MLLFSSQGFSQSYPGFPESFDAGTVTPTGWSTVLFSYSGSDGSGCGCVDWQWATSYGGYNPLEPTHSGAGMLWYNSYDMYSGNEEAVFSPAADLTTYSSGTNTVSFWMFRSNDVSAGWGGYESDFVDVYVYSPTWGGYYYLDEIHDGINQSPTVSAEGWYQYSYTLPSFFSSYNDVQIVLDGISEYAVDMYVDDVSFDHVPLPPCTGTPSVSITTVPAICINVPFTLTATASPDPSTVSGITYQWQSSNSATGPWTAIPGETNATYSTSITTTTYYQCLVNCSASGLTGTSNVDTTVVTPIPGTPIIGSNSPVCSDVGYNPNNIILNASDALAGVSYTWSGPNGFSVTNDPSPTQTISDPPLSAAGTYTVYASLNGCSSGSNSTNVVVNPTPVPPVVSPSLTSYCQFQTGVSQLTASGSNVLWHTAASGGVGSSTAPIPSVANAGLFFWYVTQTSGGCESAAAMDSVLVKNKPAVPYTSLSIYYCQDDVPAELTAIGANMLWYNSATGGIGSSVAPLPSTSIAGTFNYYVSQTVNGCESDRATIAVIIRPKPGKPGVAVKNYCQGDFSLPLAATGSNLTWYTTSSGGFGTPMAPIPPTSYADTQYYYVTSTLGVCESDRAQLVVIVDYTPNALILSNQPYVCQFDSTFFTYYGNALPDATYNWTLPSGASLLHGISQGPIWAKFDSAGKRVITLQVTNKKCKSPITSYILDVRQAPNVSTNIRREVCQGDILDVSLGYANEKIDNFNWNFDGGEIVFGSEGGPYGIRYNTSGQYIIEMVANTNSCPSIPRFDTVTVHTLADAHIGTVSNSNICAGDSIVFTTERYNPAYLYQWQPAIYFGTQNNQSQVYGFIEHSGYVKLQVTTEFGCTSTDSTLISAQPCCEVFFPNAFTPNGDGKNDIFRPVSAGNQVIKTFFVTNRWGQKVFETVNPHIGWDGKLNGVLQDLGTYYYFIKYVCANGRVFEEKGEVILLR